MRLHDAVNIADPFLVQTSDGKIHRLPGAADLSRQIAAAPVRYVLDDAAAALVSHTAFGKGDTLTDAIDILRFPLDSFWIEWNEPGRMAVLREAGLAVPDDGACKTGRAGAFVKADNSGRRGEIVVFWEGEDGAPERSPFTIEFDLDDPAFASTEMQNALTRNICVRDGTVLDVLYQHARYRLTDGWRDYYQDRQTSDTPMEAIIKRNVASIADDLPFIAAFCLVLSARGALRYEASNLDRLNAARERKGSNRLLDHLTVKLDLEGISEAGGVGGGLRGSPRLHHVCGHLVRRGDNLHWRRPHLRGNPQKGMISSRTIEVVRLSG